MTLQLGGGGAITGCTSLADPVLTLDGLVVGGTGRFDNTVTIGGTVLDPNITLNETGVAVFKGEVSTATTFTAGTAGNGSIRVRTDSDIAAFWVGQGSNTLGDATATIFGHGKATFKAATDNGVEVQTIGGNEGTKFPFVGKNTSGTTTFKVNGDGNVQSGGDPASGAAQGTKMGAFGAFNACRTTGSNSVFVGYTEGNATATVDILADGRATFKNLVTIRNDATYALKVGGNSGAEFYLEIGQPSTNASPAINYSGPDASLRFINNGTDAGRFDGSGRFLLGLITAPTFGAQAPYARLGVFGNTYDPTAGGYINLGRNEPVTAITSGNSIGTVVFPSAEGRQYGKIECVADGASSASSCSGKLFFYTTPDGTTTPENRLAIYRNGITIFRNGQSAIQQSIKLFNGNNAFQNITSWSNQQNQSSGGMILVMLHNHTGTQGGKQSLHMIYINYDGTLGGTTSVQANGITFDSEVSQNVLRFKAFDNGTGLSTQMGYSLIYSDARAHTTD